MYIRLGKAGEQVFHPQEIQSYHLGDLLPIINKGSETLVLTSGSILARVMESVETKHLDYDVFTVPVIKPLNATQLCQLAENRRQIKELAKEGITFLRNIGGKELHEAQ